MRRYKLRWVQNRHHLKQSKEAVTMFRSCSKETGDGPFISSFTLWMKKSEFDIIRAAKERTL